MKKLVIILCFVLLFCSCGKEVVLEENESLSFPKENEIEKKPNRLNKKNQRLRRLLLKKQNRILNFIMKQFFLPKKFLRKILYLMKTEHFLSI